MGRARIRVLAVAFVVGAALAVVPAAQATGSYVFGPTLPFYSADCNTYVASHDQDLNMALVGSAYLGYEGNPAPHANDVYYIGIYYASGGDTFVAGGAYGSCDAYQNASLQLALPTGAALAISSATPILCATIVGTAAPTTFTNGCPTTAQTGTKSGYYKFDPPAGSDEGWKVVEGDTIEVDVPVKSSSAMTNATNKSCTSTSQGCAGGYVRVWDGFENSNQPLYVSPTVGVTVQAPAQTTPPATIDSESTSDITSSSATTTATVNNEGQAGTTKTLLYNDGGGEQCPYLMDGQAYNVQSLGSSTTSVPVTTNFTGLAPETKWCWQQEFIPSGGGAAVVGSFVTFITPPAPVTPPTLTDFSTTNVTSSSATANATLTPNGAEGMTHTEVGTDSSDGSCTSPSGIQYLGYSEVGGLSGTVPLSTSMTGLGADSWYCWRQVFDPNDPSLAEVDGPWQSFKTFLALYRQLFTYPSPSTTSIATTSAIGQVTVHNYGQAGQTNAQIGTASGGSCSSPANIQTSATEGVSGSVQSVAESTTFSDLAASTEYCWQQTFTPAGGTTSYGAWQTFTTEHLLLISLAPRNSSAPAISGSITAGQALTATHGTWSNLPTSYSYQWNRCDATGGACSTITGATSQTYVLGPADVGHTIVVQASASNHYGTGGPASSAATGVVAAASNTSQAPASSTLPTISGSTVVGQTLTASAGTWSGTPPMTYGYRWQRCDPTCAAISGATGATYTLASADAGATIEVIVTATNGSGDASADAAPVGPVTSLGPRIAIALRGLLAPSGKHAKIKALVKSRGYAFTFDAPSVGKLQIVWYQVPKGARKARAKVKPVVIASGSVNVSRPGPVKIELKLTRQGRKLLKRSKRIKLESIAAFKAAGLPAVTATGRFTLS
jgi:hypothetical protein